MVSAKLCLNAGKFPTLVTHQESLESKVNEIKATVKFQLKKVLCMGVAVGNCGMEDKQIFQNVQMSVLSSKVFLFLFFFNTLSHEHTLCWLKKVILFIYLFIFIFDLLKIDFCVIYLFIFSDVIPSLYLFSRG